MKTPEGKKSPHIVHRVPGGLERSQEDDDQARWGRDRHEGIRVGQHIQSPPMLFTADHLPVWMADTYRGRSAFLVSSGPSFADDEAYPKDLLRQPGIMTMGLNNSPKTFRPNLWCSVDSPHNWIKSIWLDPQIQKFVPICHTQKTIFDSDQWKDLDTRVMECPNVFYYKRNEHFQADQFLYEDTFNWGNHKKYGGGRSIMLVAIRLLYYLGFRRVYLLGVDFEMKEGAKNYSFDQHRHPSSVAGNNSTYQLMKSRFEALKPFFDAEGFKVFNCNPNSALKVFPHIPYLEAINQVREEFGNIDVFNERTEGLYDREYKAKKEREAKQNKKEAKIAREEAKRYTDDERREVKERLDFARSVLDDAKMATKQHQDRKIPDNAPLEAIKRHENRLKELVERENRFRTIFRTIEDEKRLKWGEPARWKLWNHGDKSQEPETLQ